VPTPPRLPPPPFWRTHHFAFDVLARRRYLDPLDIARIIGSPLRRKVGANGRIQLWGFSAAANDYLKIVLLEDGETVHTAYKDRDFEP
jgi:hypothetical protein